ncbi:MORN repeat-containing protein 5-like isoform X2 [Pseudomyrmex gracilis]|uniref:MORN repeat-containing protein 5-like isoform X2 n=1 Tax=Pseudomyrmex gracilis TaxID=219809 RepID=UPI000995281C|nr:MORN repeat-containing protein 5-like isoform X2 [Pseudomyrmex gracilis]
MCIEARLGHYERFSSYATLVRFCRLIPWINTYCKDGVLHGEGSMRWPQGQRIDGTWDRGKLVEKRYTFADGLSYQEDGWDYCKPPDRRFYNCILNGLRPARKVLKTNTQPTKIITPFGYDTGTGIFDYGKKCVASYRNCKKILEIPTTEESTWIRENCRKGWTEPTGYREWLHEYWHSGAAEFETLLPEDETENWWQRLTTFVRHSPDDKTKTT